MDSKNVSRRTFLGTAASGAALTALATVLPAGAQSAKEEKKVDAKKEEKKEVKKEEKKGGIYICAVCGHVEFGVIPDACPICHASKEQFKQDDALFSANEAKFKEVAAGHTPVLVVKKSSTLITEKPTTEALVRVGKKLHPMEEAHFIRWIDCYGDDKFVSRIFLSTGVEPAAGFFVKGTAGKIRVVSWCNLHGYWQAEA
jgi:desulfoferrodoxin